MRQLRRGLPLMLLILSGTMGWPQSTAVPFGEVSTSVSALPEPYVKEEFPPWAHGLRRFEIISLGAFPILLFYTRFVYDTSLFFGSGFDSDGFDSRFAPWPFRNENSYTPTDDEQIARVLTAAGLSLVLGGIDALFIHWKQADNPW